MVDSNDIIGIGGKNYLYCENHDIYYSEKHRTDLQAKIDNEPNEMIKRIMVAPYCPLCSADEGKSLRSAMDAMGPIEGP